MKKALIINEWPSYLINESGCNVFSYKLIHFLNENNFNVDEIIFKTPNNDIDWKTIYSATNYKPYFLNLNPKDKFINKTNAVEKNIENIIKDNGSYDIIISNFHLGFKRLNKLKNFFFIPHNSYEIIAKYGVGTKKNKFLLPFYKMIRKLINHKDPFVANNIIVFDQWTKNKIEKHKKYKNPNVFLIPIFHNFYNDSQTNIYNNERRGVFYIGRLSNKQKNLKLLNRVANNNINIDVYGRGGDEYLLTSPNITKHGIVKDDKKREIFKNKKVMILTSKYEGSPIVAIESLSYGIPIVLLDSFPFAKYVTENTESIVLSKNSKAKEISNAINYILNLGDNEYKKIQEKCFRVYLEKFSNEIAKEKWKEILDNLD